MANIKSNEKRARQSIKRYQRNRMWKEKVKNTKKRIAKYVLSGNIDKAELKKMLLEFQSIVDKTYTKGVFKKNKVSRLKSRMYNFISKHVDLKSLS
ncbi:MAG: 30S ribosomal protein S20 [Spirochaetia bacterium]|nr:30S ribosomal protein S20 [Spirochaetota bacterium]MCX8095983.1 30S ribosomal protein S20 [Spirochaetota bacterium]MDW8113038.1 30S ribosomal protein S20 [Spirochaetia bacterium]